MARPGRLPGRAGRRDGRQGVVATASFYRSVRFAAETARLIGRDEDAAQWAALADRIRDGSTTHYVSDDGTILSDCATVYSLAI